MAAKTRNGDGDRLGLRVLGNFYAQRPDLDSPVEIRHGRFGMMPVIGSGGLGERAVRLAIKQQRPFFRKTYGKSGGLRLDAGFGVRNGRPGRQFDAIEISLRF